VVRLDADGHAARTNRVPEKGCRLTLDQEIEGSNPSSPANRQDMGLIAGPGHYILWFGRVSASVAKEATRCNGHLTLLIFGHLTLSVAARGHQTLMGT
jgi:hypothetical protein